ncbi:hypothetical protein [Sporosarcina cyprini]|uniref:hypothetical protein n=1 Tax=Sporosarcina cyprini TaxID=2910523 RepID=UPI001EDE66CE|nr:hypothetical protein [Sporosarcina cyprini]MCG3086674.1 hypothetical protein [Sporosarcina cyprini]
MNKLTKYVALPTLAISLFFGQHTSIYAAENEKKAELEQKQKENSISYLEIQNSLSQYGVQQKVQVELLSKLEKGELWDSMKEDSIPVEEETVETTTGTKTIRKFEDGSILITGILAVESDPSSYKPLGKYDGVTPGTIIKGSGYVSYKDAVVYYDDLVTYIAFNANFTILQGAMDFIDRVWEPKFKSKVGSATNISVGIIQAKETLDDPAEAKMDLTINWYNGGVGAVTYLKLLVGKDTFRPYPG